MITVRTRRKIGMTQQQLGGTKEEAFIISLGQNFIDFVDKYSEDGQCEDSLLYEKMSEYVKNKDYENIKKLFSTIQVFGTYDKVTQFTTKYKTVKSAVGNAYNGTMLEGGADEKTELDRIVAHTCGMCSPKGDEFLAKLLA
ncbi:hypothetical protein [Pseudobutyrivibrio xylanivorans]|uniref:Uncharacterized protein n=1 Tax=Pseudobutyrivibrio xylanivorans DSM 14809 TaxID=1123012 RepID=A0A1M6CE25_PSEXY|nr:hypothetical protein [Pseudobutyrivibrio xylanivorans]SHI59071.1 hypothetical protein SAMN02745725_00677 [Pseudobutyrivibrio xylanivorans DSM 14809]